jgi:spermidine/putrescine transport system permease protein
MLQWISSTARGVALTFGQTVSHRRSPLLAIWTAVEGCRRAATAFFRRNGYGMGGWLAAAVLFWVLFLIVVPQLFMLDLSFSMNLPRSQTGGPNDVHTLANYRSFFVEGDGGDSTWNVTQLLTFSHTIVSSILVTFVSVVICYPVAFYVTHVAPARRARLFLLLILLPYWLNEVLRAYAFGIIFSDEGFLNRILMISGLVDAPVDFMNRNLALYTGLVYSYLLFMFFPLYSALQSVAQEQIEAARDLGAPWWHVHLFVVLPAARTGITSGCTLVFMMCAGSLVIPQVLGGTSSLWFTPIVYDRFFESFNWPQGAAYATLLVLACSILVALAKKIIVRPTRRAAQ